MCGDDWMFVYGGGYHDAIMFLLVNNEMIQ